MKRMMCVLILLAVMLTAAAAADGAPEEPALPDVPETWTCPNCGAEGNTSAFCPDCGAVRPDDDEAEWEDEGVAEGSIITFGTWEQDNKKSGLEPIEWIVLKLDGTRALVTSRYGLVKAWYNNESAGQTWADCTLRTTLNDSFYNDAFTPEEKAAILGTHVPEGEDQWDPAFPPARGRKGKDTVDRIFVLSYAEIMEYMPTEEDRMCYVTELIKVKGNRSDKLRGDGYTCWYWLRHPTFSNNAGVVGWDGEIDSCYMNHQYGVARPCCWVDLAVLGLVPAEEQAAPAYHLLDTVRFGRYNQSDAAGSEAEPIEWIILNLDEETGTAMLMSRFALDTRPYNERSGRTTWEECSLRAWLNDGFLQAAFTPEEQEAILVTSVSNGPEGMDPRHPFNDTATLDRIYLPSYNDFVCLIGRNEMSRCAPTPWAVAQGAYLDKSVKKADGTYSCQWWWLRSPGNDHSQASVVDAYAKYQRNSVDKRGLGVRPCCRVDLAKLAGIAAPDAEGAEQEEQGEE